MFTKLEQRSWIKLKCHKVVIHKNDFRDCLKRMAMQRCHIAQWHDVLKRSVKAGMPFRTTSVQEYSTGEQHNSTPCFPDGCWSPMYCAWISSGSRSMSQNCAPDSALHSGLPQTCSALDNPWNFLSAAMAPLCSCTGLFGPVPKGR